jgi:hypothetical protein
MDQDLIAYLDQRFGSLDQRLKDLRWELNQRFEKLEEAVHLGQITVESLRGELRLVAEAMMGFPDQMERHSAEVDRRLVDLKALLGPVYKSLEIKTDSQVTELSRRVVVLEERAARETRDIIELLREKYGAV